MKKLVVVGAGAAVATGAAVSLLFGTGIAAAAPDVVGQTFSDAASAIEDGGSSAKVAVTVGSKLSQDECIVTNAWDAPFVRDGSHADGEVMVALNCDGDHATETHPGASVASPAGREAKEAADEAAAEEEAQLAAAQAAAEQEAELEEVSTPDE